MLMVEMLVHHLDFHLKVKMLWEIEHILDGKLEQRSQVMEKKVKRNYCSKTFNGGIFRLKHHLDGTRYDSEPCFLIPEEIKILMMKVVSNVKNALVKKTRLSSLKQIDGGEERG